jgi:hypothetical protein
MWPIDYDDRLLEWRLLREQAEQEQNLESLLVLVDTFWQRAPTIPHYLHIDDYLKWPNPWELLVENNFCELAKCLGIVYTLLILNRTDITEITIIETKSYHLVKINDKHILNYYPNEIVIKEQIDDYTIVKTLDSKHLSID